MGDLPKLLTQARAVPHMVNGTANGFALDYVAPASFYEKIGVQAGDILQRVNGVDIRDPDTMLGLLQQLKNERVVKLDLVRNNQSSTVTYTPLILTITPFTFIINRTYKSHQLRCIDKVFLHNVSLATSLVHFDSSDHLTISQSY